MPNSLAEQIKSIKGKQQLNAFVNDIYGDKKKFDLLMDCFFSEDLRLCQKASWPILHIGIKHHNYIYPYLDKMVQNLNRPSHDAVIRNTVRIFQDIEIPEHLKGPLYDKCFEYLADPKYPTAVKAFSMTILTNIADVYPELRHELIAVIEEQLPYSTVGFKSRAKKELIRLNRKSVK